MSNLRVIVAGMGVQGAKRTAVAGSDVVATVDPYKEADFKDMRDVPSDSYDAALLCIPDEEKLPIMEHLLSSGKHILVEKPVLAASDDAFKKLATLAESANKVCYTAYNHRFEPHYVRMKDAFASGKLGRIYSIRMFYGNGTARLVRDSAWRDQGAGVLPDLGSHLLDTLRFWIGDEFNPTFQVVGAHRHENRSFDHVVLSSDGPPAVQLEVMLTSWRNHHTTDVFAENGSAHIESLCKWGPSTFTLRERILPSGRPTENTTTLVEPDPTWALEYEHFKKLCAKDTASHTLCNDLWLCRVLDSMARETSLPGLMESDQTS